jgi:hypothetical protein
MALFGAVNFLAFSTWAEGPPAVILASSWEGLYYSIIIGSTLGIAGAPSAPLAKVSLAAEVIACIFYVSIMVARSVALLRDIPFLREEDIKRDDA